MNLKGKYIEINENNVEYIINLLYSKGYSWREFDIEKILIHIKCYMGINGYLYIKFLSQKSFIVSSWVSINYIKYDINHILREYKLKRILK